MQYKALIIMHSDVKGRDSLIFDVMDMGLRSKVDDKVAVDLPFLRHRRASQLTSSGYADL